MRLICRDMEPWEISLISVGFELQEKNYVWKDNHVHNS